MRNLSQHRSAPLVYLITDRRLLQHQPTHPNPTALIDFINQAVSAGVDMVQIRERDLSARDLFNLSEAISKSLQGSQTSVLVNDRADVAASAAIGVHLTTRSLSVEVVRLAFGAEMLVGVSTHTLLEAEAAERGGADFIVFGPVFETVSKKEYGEPKGLDELHRVAAHLSIPVLALGGVKLSNYREALDAGAAGVAAISMFTDAEDLKGLVKAIKR